MDKLTLETIQWTSLSDIDNIDPISDKDYEVLAELRSVLLKRGFHNRFGICLLHRHFDLSANEVLMETTDPEARISTLKVEDAAATSSGSIGTMWRFSPDTPPLVAVKCVVRCHTAIGHTRRHMLDKHEKA